VPFVELDAIHHQPGWRPLPKDEFRRRIAAVVADDGWVIDGNYSGVQDLVWDRADTVIWFDLPRRTVMRRLVLRTLRRAITRAELWNGNRERSQGSYGSIPTDRLSGGHGPNTRNTATASARRRPTRGTRTRCSSGSARVPTRLAYWPPQSVRFLRRIAVATEGGNAVHTNHDPVRRRPE
jgi:hypothetical protein